jgi:hypothetical protein
MADNCPFAKGRFPTVRRWSLYDPERYAGLFTVRFPDDFSQRHDPGKAVWTSIPNAAVL